MLAYIPYMDPMGYRLSMYGDFKPTTMRIYRENKEEKKHQTKYMVGNAGNMVVACNGYDIIYNGILMEYCNGILANALW